MSRTGIDRRHFLTLLVATTTLAGCTASMPRMGAGPPNVGMRQAMRMGPAPVKGAEAAFAFVQINGAPADHMMEFERAITREASARRLKVVQADDPDTTYMVRGYLSAIGDKTGTLLVYVWDVMDRDGRRLHRVSGQEPSGGTSSDPWAGIDRDTVETAAGRTIDDLVAWVS